MKQQQIIALFGLSIVTLACVHANCHHLPVVKASPVDSAPPSPTANVANNQMISASGIGPAKLGMRLGELKQILGSEAQFFVQSPYMVDVDAISVVQNGEVQYYLLYPAGTSLTDADIIKQILTDNPDYKTGKGIGPGTSLQQAEAVYGDATLRYNTANEGREFVTFANEPTFNLSFRLGSVGDGTLAGIYSRSAGEFNETHQYRPDAKITSVLVDCRGLECGKP